MSSSTLLQPSSSSETGARPSATATGTSTTDNVDRREGRRADQKPLSDPSSRPLPQATPLRPQALSPPPGVARETRGETVVPKAANATIGGSPIVYEANGDGAWAWVGGSEADISQEDQSDDQRDENNHDEAEKAAALVGGCGGDRSHGRGDERDRDRDRDVELEQPNEGRAQDEDDMATWSGRAAVKGGSETVRMALLTFASVGVTFTWGVEMTYCTPYLLSLGLTKGQTSLVWIAGPLSGLIVQPIVGVVSDGSKSKWGRRRPFILSCSAMVALGLLTLGFTKELVGLFVANDTPGSAGRLLTIALAVIALYTTDFAINAVMSCARSLIVDTLPIHKQQAGAAWASRMSSIGHIIGYGAGAVDLIALFGKTLGDTQFKQLTVVAAFGILGCSAVTCWAVSERVLVSERPELRRSIGGVGQKRPKFKVFRQIWSTLLTLPPRIQAICWAVFWSWIGWFPFLIYSSTWVGETYFRYDVPQDAKDTKDALGDMGRIGSYALTVYSIITFLGAWILPVLVRSPDDDDGHNAPDRPGGPLSILADRGFIPRDLLPVIARLNAAKPDLLSVWVAGNLMFATAMSLAPFAASFRFATALVALCGIPWTIAMWAPTAFLGVEVNRLTGSSANSPTVYRRLSTSSLEMALLPSRQTDLYDGDDGPSSSSPGGTAAPGRPNPSPGVAAGSATGVGDGGGELSGVYFGILNIYTTLPQFVGTFISTIVFAILEPGKSPELATDAHPSEHHGTDGPNAIAVCLFIGAISAVGASYATRRLKYL